MLFRGFSQKPKKKRGKKKKYNDPVKVIDVTTVDDTAEKSKGKQEVEDPKNNLTIEYAQYAFCCNTLLCDVSHLYMHEADFTLLHNLRQLLILESNLLI